MVLPKRLGNRFSAADFELSGASPIMTAILHRRNLLVLILAVCMTSWAADKPTADRIVIVKSRYTLTLMNHGQVLKTYKVALGGDPVGPKVKAGDKKTPEGEYVI